MNTVQYIWPNEVFGLVKEDFTTPSGGEIVRVAYSDGSSEIMSKKVYDLLATDAATDFTNLRERKFKAVIPEVVKLMMEYDFKSMECHPFLNKVMDSLQDNYDRASNFLWTGNDKSWIPGFGFVENRTLLECDNVLKKINKDAGTSTKEEGNS